MELRHLRYFVAIAEEGSFTQAAERRLHTAQPSLSRQIRDLETTLGVTLIRREARGLTLTPAGQVFLEHARLILSQVGAAINATRRAALPAKLPFAVGFLTGQEIGWLPRVLDVLREELERIELTIHSASSPELMQSLRTGTLDAAFLRIDADAREIEFIPLIEEKLFALLPAGHALARQKSVRIHELAAEKFISFSAGYAPMLRQLIDRYLLQSGLHVVPAQEAETLPMVISMVLSTGGVSLLPAYMARLLPASVVERPLRGTAPTIPLALGYSRSNASAVLKDFLFKVDALKSTA
jgi:LysR family transcriptional regulator, hca operon transcriptional activator